MIINLTNGKYALVDDEDWEQLSQYKWSHQNGYAIRSKRISKDKVIQFKMHREIMNAPNDYFVDHINGDGLDNRRNNLRLCTNQQNQYNSKKSVKNTSGYKGIHWRKNRNSWVVRVSADGVRHFIGMYKDINDAIVARNIAMKRLQGEFARCE